MKKKVSLMLFAVMVTFLGISSVSAATGETSYMKGPNAYIGRQVYSPIISMTSPTYSSVEGDRTYTYFSNLGWLRSSVAVADDNRWLSMSLVENDGDALGVSDTFVKIYYGDFTQRQLTNIRFGGTYYAAALDGSNDNTVELAFLQDLGFCAGDTDGADTGELFYYKYKVD